MRVLWFSITPALYNPVSNAHNGGGWIASLEQIVRKNKDIELGIAFYFGNDYNKYRQDGVTYYTLPNDSRNIILRHFIPETTGERIERYLKIIDDFKPDVIQIFGSENDFGLICDKTEIPVVIHMQGCLPPYHNALFPIGMNSLDFWYLRGLSLHRRLMGLRSEIAFRKNAEREEGILRKCKNFMGRTDWDRGLINLYNPKARYFHCEEALRDSFIDGNHIWQPMEDGKLRIISVISTPWNKGVDLILKTAKLLKQNSDIDFEWNVYGVSDIRMFENKYNIKGDMVGVKIRGSVGKEELVKALTQSSVYVHTSYIENSPNSLCEAQYLGVPVIATHVGGISSLVKDGETGILFPANDPYTLASLLRKVALREIDIERMAENERTEAHRRHNPEAIGKRIYEIYRDISTSASIIE